MVRSTRAAKSTGASPGAPTGWAGATVTGAA